VTCKRGQRWVLALSVIALGGSLTAVAVELNKPADRETIMVSAELAWEDPGSTTTHYRGNFVLRTPEWSVKAAEASVYGSINNPDRIVLSGAPARIWINQPEQDKVVHGAGAQVEYRLDSKTVTMTGDAELHDGDDTVNSESIVYDIKADAYSAGGTGRVRISINPDKRQ